MIDGARESTKAPGGGELLGYARVSVMVKRYQTRIPVA